MKKEIENSKIRKWMKKNFRKENMETEEEEFRKGKYGNFKNFGKGKL